jgi:hypothetical protein
MSINQRTFRERRRARGLCIDCPEPAAPAAPFARCFKHRLERAAIVRAKRVVEREQRAAKLARRAA